MELQPSQSAAEGRSLLESGRLPEAIASLSQAAERFPDNPEILALLARARHAHGQVLPALRAYDRIIELDAADAGIWLATANALADIGEHAQALGAFENSRQLDDTNPETFHNLARAHYRLGDTSGAARHLEQSLALRDSMESWQSLATLIPALPEADNGRIAATRQAFARKLADWTGTPWPAKRDRPAPRNRGTGPLRIGYVCAFFHNANYTKPVWALINHHDRSKFHISLFSDSPPDEGMPCYEPREGDEVHDVRSLDNVELAALVRASDVDVLVDLNAYSFETRLGLFLGYPAPINAAWWAMYAASGLPGIDYLVGDDEMIRPGEEPFYTERLVRLPVSYLTFTVGYPVPPVVPPPCLERGHFTFGCLAPQYKITPHVLDAWSEILRRAGDARLLLANRVLKSPHNRAYVIEQFERRGVDPARLDLHGPADHFTYLRHYDNMDLALDTFPYNGGTTTMEAIWQGVPVLAVDGDRWVARTTQTLLRRCHLAAFVCRDTGDMIERGVAWARDGGAPARLAELRRDMRRRLAEASVCDGAGLARAMEAFYLEAISDEARRRLA